MYHNGQHFPQELNRGNCFQNHMICIMDLTSCYLYYISATLWARFEGRRHNLAWCTLSWRPPQKKKEWEFYSYIYIGFSVFMSDCFYLCSIMIITDKKETPAASYIMLFPLDFQDMSIIVSSLVTILLKKEITLDIKNKWKNIIWCQFLEQKPGSREQDLPFQLYGIQKILTG